MTRISRTRSGSVSTQLVCSENRTNQTLLMLAILFTTKLILVSSITELGFDLENLYKNHEEKAEIAQKREMDRVEFETLRF